MLRALAAGEIRHERKTSCCRAAEQPAIRAGGSIDQAANLQVADFAVIRLKSPIGSVQLIDDYCQVVIRPGEPFPRSTRNRPTRKWIYKEHFWLLLFMLALFETWIRKW